MGCGGVTIDLMSRVMNDFWARPVILLNIYPYKTRLQGTGAVNTFRSSFLFCTVIYETLYTEFAVGGKEQWLHGNKHQVQNIKYSYVCKGSNHLI